VFNVNIFRGWRLNKTILNKIELLLANMGYWEEKSEYEEGLEDKYTQNRFCKVCGRKLIPKNIKGKCIECDEVICNVCANIYHGKVTCVDCKQNLEDNKITKKQREKQRGVIPIWLVVIGFLFYIVPGIILLLIRNQQLRSRGLIE
tara:strand:+ start:862 stop:1299 length:438 start_codon:yes stop_codon:yes gene_type:complete